MPDKMPQGKTGMRAREDADVEMSADEMSADGSVEGHLPDP
jgi:hypothetical protein